MDIKQQLEELKATIEENATDEQKEQMRLAREEQEKIEKNEKFLHALHESLADSPVLKQLERRTPIRFSEKVWKQRRKHMAEVKASRKRNRG